MRTSLGLAISSALIVGAIEGRAIAAEPNVINYGNNPSAGRFYDIRGFKMYTEVYGAGPSLLMIHGNNGSISAFAHNIPFFSKHYKVILADSRSQGKSLDPDHSLNFEMMADDCDALLDAMKVDSADVLGWSDGGNVALLLAMRHPEKVKKLVSTGANLNPDAGAFRQGFWAWEKTRYDAKSVQTRTTAKEKNDWKLFLLDWKEPHIAPASLSAVQCPSLIVCGDHDLISLNHTILIFESLPHAELWVVPNSGHATLIEHADDFDKYADDFFRLPFVDHK